MEYSILPCWNLCSSIYEIGKCLYGSAGHRVCPVRVLPCLQSLYDEHRRIESIGPEDVQKVSIFPIVETTCQYSCRDVEKKCISLCCEVAARGAICTGRVTPSRMDSRICENLGSRIVMDRIMYVEKDLSPCLDGHDAKKNKKPVPPSAIPLSRETKPERRAWLSIWESP